jgi:hypothetical protein
MASVSIHSPTLRLFRNLKNTQVIATLAASPQEEIARLPHGYRPPSYRPDHWRLFCQLECSDPVEAKRLLRSARSTSSKEDPMKCVVISITKMLAALPAKPRVISWERMDWKDTLETRQKVAWPLDMRHVLLPPRKEPPYLKRIADGWGEGNAFSSKSLNSSH